MSCYAAVTLDNHLQIAVFHDDVPHDDSKSHFHNAMVDDRVLFDRQQFSNVRHHLRRYRKCAVNAASAMSNYCSSVAYPSLLNTFPDLLLVYLLRFATHDAFPLLCCTNKEAVVMESEVSQQRILERHNETMDVASCEYICLLEPQFSERPIFSYK